MTQRRIYQDEYPYFVTIRTREAFELFAEMKYVELVVNIIFKTCKLKYFDVLAYQIMPDHAHILVYHQLPRARAAVPALPILNGRAPTAGCAGKKYFNISDLMHGIKSYFCDVIRKNTM